LARLKMRSFHRSKIYEIQKNKIKTEEEEESSACRDVCLV
jgi:hypothetical protein